MASKSGVVCVGFTLHDQTSGYKKGKALVWSWGVALFCAPPFVKLLRKKKRGRRIKNVKKKLTGSSVTSLTKERNTSGSISA